MLFTLQLDAYWTYELCHGRHIKQFHELKAGVPVCILEIFLLFQSLTVMAAYFLVVIT